MKDEEDVLKELAHYEINSCCQTLCMSSIVKEYIKTLEDEIVILKRKLEDVQL